MADKYILRVTAGPSYDIKSQTEVAVNSTSSPLKITNDLVDAEVAVRIQNYRGLPRNSPSTSPYFSTPPHSTNHDQYGIAIRFTLKKPSGSSDEGVNAADLQFGNDFDHPIRDRLPPGFNTAMNIVKWWIDPGLDGDAYADTPHLYGPGLSSFNVVRCGAGKVDASKGGLWVEEGNSDSEGDSNKGRAAERRSTKAPADSKARMKWALRADAKKAWTWRYGQPYAVDFFNPYLNFADLSLRLPGFSLPIMKYWDGQGLRSTGVHRSHTLRYVLRNRTTGQVYLVILFTIFRKDDVNEDGSLKVGVLEAAARASGGLAHGEPMDKNSSEHAHFDEDTALAEAKQKLSGMHAGEGPETHDDDVD